jgi:UPF0042 nucleotide-binding protein
MEFLIISGLSGAGKSRAADILEDLDFYCVDNMPVALLPKFAELCLATRGRYERVALVTDVRERESFDELFKALDGLVELNCDYKILFMTADVASVVKRYKETRRRHPLAPNGGSLEVAVRREIKLLERVRARADYVVDTTNLNLGRLQNILYEIFVGDGKNRKLSVNVMAFGFKYGIPIEADLVFDVRFLPNPFYVPGLKEKTGLDPEVQEYVFDDDRTKAFMEHLEGMVKFLMPLYVEEGKHSLTIAIGCTGGRHRSVAVAEALRKYIKDQGQTAMLLTRDMEK